MCWWSHSGHHVYMTSTIPTELSPSPGFNYLREKKIVCVLKTVIINFIMKLDLYKFSGLRQWIYVGNNSYWGKAATSKILANRKRE